MRVGAIAGRGNALQASCLAAALCTAEGQRQRQKHKDEAQQSNPTTRPRSPGPLSLLAPLQVARAAMHCFATCILPRLLFCSRPPPLLWCPLAAVAVRARWRSRAPPSTTDLDDCGAVARVARQVAQLSYDTVDVHRVVHKESGDKGEREGDAERERSEKETEVGRRRTTATSCSGPSRGGRRCSRRRTLPVFSALTAVAGRQRRGGRGGGEAQRRGEICSFLRAVATARKFRQVRTGLQPERHFAAAALVSAQGERVVSKRRRSC